MKRQLKFNDLLSNDLKTCQSAKNHKITKICKHTDLITPGSWFLDEKNTFPITKENIISNTSKSIKTLNAKKTWAELSSIAYPNQPKYISLITGTDGKTSVAWITYQLWMLLGIKAGYIGTLGIFINGTKYESELTTPDSSDLHYYLNKMHYQNIQHVSIEASSIGLDQERLSFVKADISIFTNFTSDHIDYHKNHKNYLNAKLKILNNLKNNAEFFVHHSINKQINHPFEYYGGTSKYQSKYIKDLKSWEFHINSKVYTVKNNIIGSFNGDNMLAAFLIIRKSGVQDEQIMSKLDLIKSVPGRLNFIEKYNCGDIFVDFAHTPNSLEKTLICLKSKYKTILLVFGCGGDRDKSKRSLMGEIANKHADYIIVTNDNPRSEDPLGIAEEITSKCKKANIILDRKKAIKQGILLLKPNSALVIAGKGEEKTQTISNEIINFYDPSTVKEIILKLKL